MSVKQDQEKVWQEHLLQAEKHPKSQLAYCRDAGIEPRKLYATRERMKARIKAYRSQKRKDVKPHFLPVTVSPPPLAAPASRVQFGSAHMGLPPAQWVAEVLLHLVRGLP